MNAFALLSLISAFVILMLGNLIFYQSLKNRLNQIFGLCCVTLACWGFSEFMYRQAESYPVAAIWIKVACIRYFSVTLLFHFIIIFFEKHAFFTLVANCKKKIISSPASIKLVSNNNSGNIFFRYITVEACVLNSWSIVVHNSSFVMAIMSEDMVFFSMYEVIR